MSDPQLSFRKSANIERVTDKRKDSLFQLVDTDGSGTIDAQEFAVLYDAIKKDLAEELEKEAALQKEASSARRRLKMLLLFVAVLVSFLAASVAANFAVIFTVVDQAITTTATSAGLLGVKGTDSIAKTAIATEDVPLLVAPVLDLDTLSKVKEIKVKYAEQGDESHMVEAQMAIVAVRKHNATFVEFVSDVPGETIEVLNGLASLSRFPTEANELAYPVRETICSANATCSAFKASGIDVDTAFELAKAELDKAGFGDRARRLWANQQACPNDGTWVYFHHCGYEYGPGYGQWTLNGICYNGALDDVAAYYGYPSPHTGAGPPGAGMLGSMWYDSPSYTQNYARHIVFFAHGKGMNTGDLWDRMCSGSTGLCDDLNTNQFRHLVFVFGGSGVWDAGYSAHGWSEDISISNYTRAGNALDDATYGFKKTIEADLGDIFQSSTQTLFIGFSDGAGLGMWLQWKNRLVEPYTGSWASNNGRWGINKVIALDYWANADYLNWLGTDKNGMMAKIYSNCNSFTYQYALGMSLFPEPGMSGATTKPQKQSYPRRSTTTKTFPTPDTSVGTIDYIQYEWEKVSGKPQCGFIHWDIHGLDSQTDHNGYDGGATDWTDRCNANDDMDTTTDDAHMEVLYHADILGDITSWTQPWPSSGAHTLAGNKIIRHNPCLMAPVMTKANMGIQTNTFVEMKRMESNDKDADGNGGARFSPDHAAHESEQENHEKNRRLKASVMSSKPTEVSAASFKVMSKGEEAFKAWASKMEFRMVLETARETSIPKAGEAMYRANNPLVVSKSDVCTGECAAKGELTLDMDAFKSNLPSTSAVAAPAPANYA
jgi:hypothetical protein